MNWTRMPSIKNWSSNGKPENHNHCGLYMDNGIAQRYFQYQCTSTKITGLSISSESSLQHSIINLELLWVLCFLSLASNMLSLKVVCWSIYKLAYLELAICLIQTAEIKYHNSDSHLNNASFQRASNLVLVWSSL